MAKYPSEIFGYPHFNSGKQAQETRSRHWCPFVDKRCYKQSRLLDYPFGVCSAHVNGNEVALCPRRFLDGHTVFTDIAQHHFGTTSDILVFPEVRLGKIGSFDFVMVKHEPMSAEIADFAVVEFQTGQTTGTGQLVQGLRDYLAGQRIAYRSYRFGLNLYDIWKRTFTQILNKGVILESWRKKIYWVVQESVYADLATRYNLQTLTLDPQNATLFALYGLQTQGQRFAVVSSRLVSASIDQLFAAFRNNPNIPSEEDFVHTLKCKIEGQAHLSLHLGRASSKAAIDVPPPTESGRVHEPDVDYPAGGLFDNL